MKKLSFTFMLMVALGAFVAENARAEFPTFGSSFGSSPLIQSFSPTPSFGMSPMGSFGSPSFGSSGGIYGQIRIQARVSSFNSTPTFMPTQSYYPSSNNVTIVNNTYNNYYGYNPYPPVYGSMYGGYGGYGGCGGSHGCGGGGYGYGGGYGGYGRGMYGARMCKYYRPRMCHHKQCGYAYARPYAKYNNTFVGVSTPFGSVVVNNSSGSRVGW